MRDAALIAFAYLLGSVPFAFIIARAVKGIDIRTVGSGNVGATNAARVLGRKWGVVVFVLDMLKGLLPTLLAQRLHGIGPGSENPPLAVALTGLAAIVGHNWPVFLKFRGGKGMATGAGVFLALFPKGLAAALIVWAGTVALTRYVSLGSMLSALVLLVCAILLTKDPFGGGRFLTALAAAAAALSIARHHSNIRRLLAGAENKIGEASKEQRP